MQPLSRNIILGAIALVAAASASGCGRTLVIVPRPARGYTATDTLYGVSKGKDVRVTFHFDTTWRRDTVTRTDTLWRGGTRTIVRVDTLRTARTDTLVRVDTVVRQGTRVRVDTVGIPEAIPFPTPVPAPVTRVDTVRITRRDTVTITRRDTIRVTVRDTLFRVDTVRVAGRRVLFVPPGQYPPEGQCRIWIHDLAPGRQAAAAPCNALGAIPRGAFILFRGDAWDFDHDWLEESRRGSVPPEIVALQRRGRP
ncbi:MAG: hypothetical protein OEW77_07860 [Gemmatimonadota bacterium]|nr:hypothetical protein [Gemmatimonadota bacterium]